MHVRTSLWNCHVGSQAGDHALVKVANILLPVLVAPGNGHKHVCRMVIESAIRLLETKMTVA
jgi:hypothetical protein